MQTKTFIWWLLSTGEDTIRSENSRKCLSTSLSGDVEEKETRKTNKKHTKKLINFLRSIVSTESLFLNLCFC